MATVEDRFINFNQSIGSILRHIRAYGSTQSFAAVGETILIAKRAIGWRELHSYNLGDIVYTNQRKMIIAATDGLIGLIDVEPFSSSIFR